MARLCRLVAAARTSPTLRTPADPAAPPGRLAADRLSAPTATNRAGLPSTPYWSTSEDAPWSPTRDALPTARTQGRRRRFRLLGSGPPCGLLLDRQACLPGPPGHVTVKNRSLARTAPSSLSSSSWPTKVVSVAGNRRGSHSYSLPAWFSTIPDGGHFAGSRCTSRVPSKLTSPAHGHRWVRDRGAGDQWRNRGPDRSARPPCA